MKKLIFFLFSVVICISCQDRKPEGTSALVPENCSLEEMEEMAVAIRPSYRQLDYQQREMLGFIHLGMNTFTQKEWGTGEELPSLFNPTQLDAEQWIKTFKEAGISAVIFVAKHHDGFCLWPSKTTTHTVANSPWRGGRGDVLRDVADACQKYGLKLCVYVSPWDMHNPTYGTEAYNDFYIKQLSEVLTGYGPVYLMWFDGAGQDASTSGVQMPFDWPRIFKAIRDIQPDVLLSGSAPDIRWVGNEAGKGYETLWCVQGIDNLDTLFGGTTIGINPKEKDLGSLEQLRTKRRLVWYPSRGGLPLRKGWFYNPRDNENLKSMNYLVDSYFSTVGQNSNLLCNLSPDTLGLIPKRDSARLVHFGQLIARMQEKDLAQDATAHPLQGWNKHVDPIALTDNNPYTSWDAKDGQRQAALELTLAKEQTFNVIKLQENIRDKGQRVSHFAVDAYINGNWQLIGESTTIGARKLLRLKENITTDRIRVRILDARVSASLSTIALFILPPVDETLSKSSERVQGKGGFYMGEVMDTPASLTFDLTKEEQISALVYKPGTEGEYGQPEWISLFTSSDGINWEELVPRHRFDNIVNNPVEQVVSFPTIRTRYVKMDILESSHKKIKIGEIRLDN